MVGDYLSSDELSRLRRYHKTNAVRLDDRSSILYENGVPILVSYWTEVAKIVDGRLVRLWGGWSATTSKHVSRFCRMFNVPAPSKKDWESMKVEG